MLTQEQFHSGPRRNAAKVPTMQSTATIERLAYSRTEAAALIGVSLFTIEKLINSGELHVKRVGRRVLVTRVALESFLKEDDEPSAA